MKKILSLASKESGILATRLAVVAAVDIGLGTNDNYNNLSSASDRFAKKIDDYFDRGYEEKE